MERVEQEQVKECTPEIVNENATIVLEYHNRKITMSNALIRAAHGLTLAEKRLIVMGISGIDSRKNRLYNARELVSKVSAIEFAETYGVTRNTAYDELQSAARTLYQRSITFYEASNMRGKKTLEATKVHMRWVGSVKYHDGEGYIELFWIPQLLHHLMGLTKQFTSYHLKQTTALRSTYSWKLLELLMRFKKNGWASYTIDDFCESMEVSEKMKKNFANIRRRVIEPAVRELTVKGGWTIKWETVTAGRKVKALRFTFVPGRIEELEDDPKNDTIDKDKLTA